MQAMWGPVRKIILWAGSHPPKKKCSVDGFIGMGFVGILIWKHSIVSQWFVLGWAVIHQISLSSMSMNWRGQPPPKKKKNGPIIINHPPPLSTSNPLPRDKDGICQVSIGSCRLAGQQKLQQLAKWIFFTCISIWYREGERERNVSINKCGIYNIHIYIYYMYLSEYINFIQYIYIYIYIVSIYCININVFIQYTYIYIYSYRLIVYRRACLPCNVLTSL